MWKPDLRKLPEAGPAARRDSRNMAIRRGLIRGRMTFAFLGVAVLMLMLAGSVFVSNQVTRLRSEIVRLEDRQDFLEAGSAQLQSAWNRRTSAEVVVARARRIGLAMPVQPDLVLVEADHAERRGAGALRRFIGRLGGAAEANAAEPPVAATGGMVSLHPRPRTEKGASRP